MIHCIHIIEFNIIINTHFHEHNDLQITHDNDYCVNKKTGNTTISIQHCIYSITCRKKTIYERPSINRYDSFLLDILDKKRGCWTNGII